MRIVLSGGGTGGHATPLLALSAALKQQSKDQTLDLHYIGSGADLERSIAKQANLTYHSILSGKYRRYGRGAQELLDIRTLQKNIHDSTRFLRGINQARKILKDIKPDAVFVKGGYVGLPVGLAASMLRIPLIIHESDTAMGLTNRILARRAQRVATGFPVTVYPARLQNKLVYVGNMVSNVFASKSQPNTNHKRPSILIIGGSTGARHINETVWECLPGLVPRCTIMHQTGEHSASDAEQVRAKLPKQLQTQYQPFAFADTVKLAGLMKDADLVISRAGANSIFELAALAKPTIIVPLHNAANNHQVQNAAYLHRHHAAHILTEHELTPEHLQEVISYLIEHPAIRKSFGQNLHNLATPKAAQSLARIILQRGAK